MWFISISERKKIIAIPDIQSNCWVFLDIHLQSLCITGTQHSEACETALMINAHALDASDPYEYRNQLCEQMQRSY